MKTKKTEAHQHYQKLVEEMGMPMATSFLEHTEIIRVLQKNNGNRSQTSREIGLNRTTLIMRLRSLGIE